MKVSNVVEFLSYALEKEFSYYRGHGNIDWPLIPSLGRISPYDYLKLPCESGSLKGMEEALIREFKKKSIPFIKHQPQTKIDWLVLAQHHGLPTRLLDWSTNSLKALFFAVENSALDNFDGVVYCCHSGFSIIDDSALDNGKVVFFFPDHLNERVIAQEGCFTLSPILPDCLGSEEDFIYPLDLEYEDQIDMTYELEKLVIPKRAKCYIRKQLIDLGIDHSSIYPGLDGISKSIIAKGLNR